MYTQRPELAIPDRVCNLYMWPLEFGIIYSIIPTELNTRIQSCHSWSQLERAVAAVTADAALLDEGADDAVDVTPMAVESADGVKVEAVAVEVDAAVAEEVRPTKVQ